MSHLGAWTILDCINILGQFYGPPCESRLGSFRFNNHLNLYDLYAQKTYDRIGNTEIV
jgi:hypothetical protein